MVTWKEHGCAAIGCREKVLLTAVFCPRHLAMLQSDVRTVLERTYRAFGKPSKVFTVTLERAQQEILYAQTVGHRTPRDAEFEW